MGFNTTFSSISVISWLSVLVGLQKKPEYSERTANLEQVTDKPCHIRLKVNKNISYPVNTNDSGYKKGDGT